MGFGPYTRLTRLATGGMGEVFLARRGTERLVVLKRLLPDLAEDPVLVRMFYDEATLAGRLLHENVARVEDFGEHDGRCFLAMEFLEGTTFTRLANKIARPLDAAGVRVMVGMVAQAARGLHHAHEAIAPDGRHLGLVHRDVCHDNLFVTRQGVVKVLDFGIAKALGTSKTRTGVLKGRFAYMTPEQLAGGDLPIDRRADVFALGVVAWELLSGRQLFQRDSDVATLHAVRFAEIASPLPGLPPALEAALRRALARDRDQRFATADDFADALAAALPPAAPEEIGAVVERLFGAAVDQLKARVADAEGQKTDEASRVTPEPEQHEETVTAIIVPPDAIWFDEGTPVLSAIPFAEATQIGPAPAAPPRLSRLAIFVAASAVVTGALIAIAVATGGPAPPPPPPPPSTVVVVVGFDAALVTSPGPMPEPEADAEAKPAPEPEPDRESERARKKRAAPGRLSVDSFPYAVIYLDGKKLGQTPLLEVSIPAGSHTVKAVRADGRSQSFSISVKPGQTLPPRRLYW